MGGVAVGPRRAGAPRAAAGLSSSEIITLLLVLHSSGFKHLKSFYHGFAEPLLRGYFPGMPCYEHFVTLQKSVFVPLVFFLQSPGDQDRALLHRLHRPCDNHRINRHKVFADLAQRGKTSMGWFFGFKLHLVFNTDNEIVALKLTPGNVHDTTPVPALTRELTGKLFGDKGYIGQKLAEDLLRRGLTLFTRVRKNMKSLPISLQDKALLNARNMAEPSSARSRNSHPSICPSIDPSSTPSFTSSRPLPPTRSTLSSPSATFSPAIISKPQPENPLSGFDRRLISRCPSARRCDLSLQTRPLTFVTAVNGGITAVGF